MVVGFALFSPVINAPLLFYTSLLQVNRHVALFLCDLGKGNWGLPPTCTCTPQRSPNAARLMAPSLPPPLRSISQAALTMQVPREISSPAGCPQTRYALEGQ